MRFLDYEAIRYSIAALILLAGITVFTVGLGYAIQIAVPIPHCVEDVVIVGSGQFTPDYNGNTGTWDAYSCGPAKDDLTNE